MANGASLGSLGQSILGLLAPGNIDLSARPIVRNPDGSISTVRSMSIGVGGKQYLIPTVSDEGTILSDEDAIKRFRQTGKHLGIFDTPDNATAFAQSLHEQQAQQYLPQANTLGNLGRSLFGPR